MKEANQKILISKMQRLACNLLRTSRMAKNVKTRMPSNFTFRNQFHSSKQVGKDWNESVSNLTAGLISSSKTFAKVCGGVSLGIFGIYTLSQSVIQTDAGYIYVIQNNLSGDFSIVTEPGIYRRVPFFSSVTTYRQVVSVNFDINHPVSVRFADTYTGLVPATFRFRLPVDSKSIIRMHKDFRSENSVYNQLLTRNAKNVTIITATQYTGEEFFQGGLNRYKQQLSDQLKNGTYVTERKQVEVEEMALAPVSSKQSDSNKLKHSRQLVWKTVPRKDDHGLELRDENPLSDYGIEVTQVLVSDPTPEGSLERLLMDKKKLVADRIKAVQEQETSKAQAKTEQLKKEIQRTRAVQDAQREKELAVISEQKQVEIAKRIQERQVVEQTKLQELALIDKEKELQIAKSNLEIGKAASAAAVFEAKAIKERGLADAAVLQARYRALNQNKEIYLAEIQRDISQVVYTNLKDFKIEIPKNYVGGSGGKMTSNLDVITSFAALATMSAADQAKLVAKLNETS